MSKIPNWPRDDDSVSGVEAAWNHDKLDQQIYVEQFEDARGRTAYNVAVKHPNGVFDDHYERSTKEDAMDEARGLARDNPRGVKDYVTGTSVDEMYQKSSNSMPDVGLEISVPTQIGGYNLEEKTEDALSYVGNASKDGKSYFVYIEITKVEFSNRNPMYAIRGRIIGEDNNFDAGFRPSTKTQYGDAHSAFESAEQIMETYSPEDAVEDEVI